MHKILLTAFIFLPIFVYSQQKVTIGEGKMCNLGSHIEYAIQLNSKDIINRLDKFKKVGLINHNYSGNDSLLIELQNKDWINKVDINYVIDINIFENKSKHKVLVSIVFKNEDFFWKFLTENNYYES